MLAWLERFIQAFIPLFVAIDPIGLAAVLDEARGAAVAHHRRAFGVAAAGQRQLDPASMAQAVKVVAVAVSPDLWSLPISLRSSSLAAAPSRQLT